MSRFRLQSEHYMPYVLRKDETNQGLIPVGNLCETVSRENECRGNTFDL